MTRTVDCAYVLAGTGHLGPLAPCQSPSSNRSSSVLYLHNNHSHTLTPSHPTSPGHGECSSAAQLVDRLLDHETFAKSLHPSAPSVLLRVAVYGESQSFLMPQVFGSSSIPMPKSPPAVHRWAALIEYSEYCTKLFLLTLQQSLTLDRQPAIPSQPVTFR